MLRKAAIDRENIRDFEFAVYCDVDGIVVPFGCLSISWGIHRCRCIFCNFWLRGYIQSVIWEDVLFLIRPKSQIFIQEE